jgi:xanthine dehydrogenase YagS FAD-binding subunit
VALNAIVEIEGRSGGREIAIEDLHRLPGDDPSQDTGLEPGDLIVAVRLPQDSVGFARHARYLKVRERTSYAFAVVSVAAALKIEGGRIVDARIAMGGVAAKPWRAHAAEAALIGAEAGEAAFARAADAALAEAKPSGDNGFKLVLAKRLVARALIEASLGTPDRVPALPASPFSSVPGAHIHA